MKQCTHCSEMIFGAVFYEEYSDLSPLYMEYPLCAQCHMLDEEAMKKVELEFVYDVFGPLRRLLKRIWQNAH